MSARLPYESCASGDARLANRERQQETGPPAEALPPLPAHHPGAITLEIPTADLEPYVAQRDAGDAYATLGLPRALLLLLGVIGPEVVWPHLSWGQGLPVGPGRGGDAICWVLQRWMQAQVARQPPRIQWTFGPEVHEEDWGA